MLNFRGVQLLQFEIQWEPKKKNCLISDFSIQDLCFHSSSKKKKYHDFFLQCQLCFPNLQGLEVFSARNTAHPPAGPKTTTHQRLNRNPGDVPQRTGEAWPFFFWDLRGFVVKPWEDSNHD